MTEHQTQFQTGDLLSSVDEVLLTAGIMANPYFAALESGEMTLESFQFTQQQFYFAVEAFPRPMAVLLMRIPRPEQRLGILENLVEEHGNYKAAAFHESTFRQFLGAIGADSNRPQSWIMRPPVHAFNSTVMAACLNEEVRIGIACLGIIEYVYADISALIGKAVIRHEWVGGEELVHYKLHAEIDKQHAEDFFLLLQSDWDLDEHEEIMRGLRLGAYALDRLYRDLLVH